MIIRDEYDYLIHLIKCTMRDLQPEEIPEGLSFVKVYKYAMAHDMANIAFYSVERLQCKPDKELYAKWQNRRDLAVTRDINQDFAAEEIRSALAEAEIRWIEVQGTRMKKLYPAPEYRTMSDIDFIVESDNLEKAKSLLGDLGYKCEVHGNGDVVAFRAPNINVELHTGYFTGKYGEIMVPDFTREVTDEEFYLYTILHLAKHYFEEGCGIRRVLDVYVMDEFYRDMKDSDYLAGCYEKAGVLEFVKDIRALAQFWFGEGEEPDRAEEMKQYITESNVHGVLEHRVQHHIGESKFKYLWKRVFQDKEMIYLRYPFIRRCKILLPVGWVMRIFYGLAHFKEKRIGDELRMVKDVSSDRGK